MIMSKFFFVVGNSRSGTNMMGQLLNNNSLVYTIPQEVHFFEGLCDVSELGETMSFDKALDLWDKLMFRAINNEQVKYLKKNSLAESLDSRNQVRKVYESNNNVAIIDVYKAFMHYQASIHGSKIACEQTPRYAYYINDIIKYLPESRFVFMIRDPRDVLLSQKKKWTLKFRKGNYITWRECIRTWVNYHPYLVSLMWLKNAEIAIKNLKSKSVIVVRYEDVVIDPEGQVSGVCDFLGIPYDKDMIYVQYMGSSTSKNSLKKSKLVNRSGIWRKGGLSNFELFVCEWICGAGMVEFGYDLSGSKLKNYMVFFLSFIGLPLKLGVSFLLNLNRTQNVYKSVIARFF